MIQFPKEFVKTKFPGYFWNIEEKKLYSIKIDGILKPLKYDKGGLYQDFAILPGYTVSVKGRRRKRLLLIYLECIKIPEQNETIDINRMGAIS